MARPLTITPDQVNYLGLDSLEIQFFFLLVRRGDTNYPDSVDRNSCDGMQRRLVLMDK
jgi:hypothetical protein